MAAAVYKSTSELKAGARQACEYFIAECKRQGLTDIFITETYRSQARQDELYAQGRTKPGKIVTNAKKSNHTSREAWDLYFTSTGYNDVSKFDKAGKIARTLGITWGGDFKTITDKPHFEYKNSTFKEPNNMTSADLKAIEAKVDKLISKFGFTDRQGWIDKLAGKKQVSTSELNAFVDKVVK